MKLTWHNTEDAVAARHADIVIRDLQRMDIERPSKLIFHHVVTEGGSLMDGPLVFVWGEKGDDEGYHCEYVEKPEWTTTECPPDPDAEKEVDTGTETR